MVLDHKDANKIIDFVDHRCRDLFNLIFDHDDYSIVVDFSKPPVYDDLSVDEVETVGFDPVEKLPAYEF